MKKISILIPMYNEELVISSLCSRLKAVMDSLPQFDWEVLMVNDGSKDGTLDLLREVRQDDGRFHYVDLSRNFGKEIAMMAGFDYATGDCVVIMDADLQHPPEVIPSMIEKWEEGYDDVYGMRLTRGKESWLRKKLSLLYYRTLQKSTRIPVLENTGDFRLLDRSCIDALKQLRETHRYTKGMYCYIGYKKIGVPFEQADRDAGESKWNFSSLFGLAIEGITSYTTAPLKISTVAGGVLFCVSIFALVVSIVALLSGCHVSSMVFVAIIIGLLMGLNFVFVGLLGEYVGRIFDETKERPVYFVREYDGSIWHS